MGFHSESQLELPGVKNPDTVIDVWMAAFRNSQEYQNRRGQYAIFNALTGEHLGFKRLSRERGDDRFSQGDEEDEITVPPGARIELIR